MNIPNRASRHQSMRVSAAGVGAGRAAGAGEADVVAAACLPCGCWAVQTPTNASRLATAMEAALVRIEAPVPTRYQVARRPCGPVQDFTVRGGRQAAPILSARIPFPEPT